MFKSIYFLFAKFSPSPSPSLRLRWLYLFEKLEKRGQTDRRTGPTHQVPGVEIRNFTKLRQKILWYNSGIPAPAINDLLPTSLR